MGHSSPDWQSHETILEDLKSFCYYLVAKSEKHPANRILYGMCDTRNRVYSNVNFVGTRGFSFLGNDKMATIVLASGNRGKIQELQTLLTPYGYDIQPQQQYNVPEIPETGTTFVENAILKARNAAKHTSLSTLSDDSGLVVPALKGQPGIYSARYGGHDANDQRNNEKLLQGMQGINGTERRAYYVCCLVYMRHAEDPTPIIAEGYWHGEILTTAQGEGGFGYDPLFYISNLQCSAAQLPADEKNKISHRGKALARLMQALLEEL